MADANSMGSEDEFSFAPAPSFVRPLASVGPHNCVSSMVLFEKKAPYTKVDSKGNANPLVPTVTVLCKSEETYEGPNGEQDAHMFWHSMPLSLNEESKMGKFFLGVLGLAVPVTANGEIDLRPVFTDQDKDGGPRHRLPRLEGLKFTVVNSIGKTKMGPNQGKPKNSIDSIFATTDQKKANAANFHRDINSSLNAAS